MVYLFIKEVAESCDRGDVIIVTQSLTKDMNRYGGAGNAPIPS